MRPPDDGGAVGHRPCHHGPVLACGALVIGHAPWWAMLIEGALVLIASGALLGAARLSAHPQAEDGDDVVSVNEDGV